MVIEATSFYVRTRCTLGLFLDSWWFYVFSFFPLFFFSQKHLITMQWWASEPHLQSQSTIYLYTQAYKNGFFSSPTVHLESFLFLLIFIIFSRARILQLPAVMKSFEEDPSLTHAVGTAVIEPVTTASVLCTNGDSKLKLVGYHTTFNTHDASSQGLVQAHLLFFGAQW